MGKFFWLILFVIISQTGFAQISKIDSIFINPGGFTPSKLKFLSENGGKVVEIIAKQDIKNDSVFIFLSSGISPVSYDRDKIFEVKYNVHFHDYGCSGASNVNMESYNDAVFDFLESKYGKAWRKEIRKDAIGLKAWKKKN